jgi:hypothetical protein
MIFATYQRAARGDDGACGISRLLVGRSCASALLHFAASAETLAGIVISHAFEQLFTTFADLLILERLSGKVLEETSVKERTRRLSHVLIVIFLILNVTNIGVMIACGAYNVRAGDLWGGGGGGGRRGRPGARAAARPGARQAARG